MNLFFSYGHDDHAELVFQLAEDISNEGHEVWIDKEGIHESDDWRDKITDGILASESVLSFISQYSMRDKGVCYDELMIAVGIRGSMIQAITLEKGTAVPTGISFHQFIDLSDWKDKKGEGTEVFDAWYRQKLDQIRSFINSEAVQRYSKEIEEIRKLLSPDLHSLKQSRLQQSSYCRRVGMIEAIRPLLNGDKRHLAIVGGPGSGKSMFIAHESLFFDLYKGNYEPDTIPAVRAVLFCDYKNRNANNVHAIIRNLAYQLAARDTDYRHALQRVIKDRERNLGEAQILKAQDDELFYELITNPLASLINGKRPDIYILIDGIDELRYPKDSFGIVNPFVDLLFHSMDDIPSWVHFILTARPDSSLIRHLNSGFSMVTFEGLGNLNIEEIQDYLSKKFQGSSFGLREAETIAKKSSGNFLYAELISKALLEGIIQSAEVKIIPEKLSDLYLRIFEKRFPDLEQFGEEFYDALAALSAAPQPIPAETFHRLTGWSSRKKQQNTIKLSSFLRNQSGSLKFSSYTFFHKSVQDWLQNEEAAVNYHIDPQVGIDVLATACLKAYNQSVEKMNDFELQYFIPFLEHSSRVDLSNPDTGALAKVLQDERLAERLNEQAEKTNEEKSYQVALDFWVMASRIYSGCLQNKRADPSLLQRAVSAMLRVVDLSHILAWPKLTCEWAGRALDLLYEYSTADTDPNLGDEGQGNTGIKERLNQLGLLCHRYAYALFREGSHERSESMYLKAIEYYTKTHNYASVYEVTRTLLEQYRMDERVQDAMALIEKMESSFELDDLKEQSPNQYCAWIRTSSWVLFDSGERKKAMEIMKEHEAFMECCSASISNNDYGRYYYIRSVMSYITGDYQQSKEFGQKSLVYLRKVYGEHSVELCDALNETAFAQQKLGNLKEACDLFYTSYSIRRIHYTDENIMTSTSLGNYAAALTAIGTPEKMMEAGPLLEYVTQVRRRICTENNRVRLGHALKAQALWFEKSEDIHSAQSYMEEAESVFIMAFKEKKDKKIYGEAGVCLKERARMALACRNLTCASDLIQKAIPILQEVYGEKHGAYREAVTIHEQIHRGVHV